MQKHLQWLPKYLFILAMVSAQPLVFALETMPDSVADKGLEQLKGLIKSSPGSFQPFGIQSLEEGLSLQRGSPMRQFRIDFTQLKQFQPGSASAEALVDMNRIIYPLRVGNEVRMLLVLTKSKDGREWKIAEWGSPNLAKALTKARTANSNTVVWIPELNHYFLGEENNKRLVPLGDLPRQKFRSGQPLPAEDVFLLLRPEAEARKGGLR